MNIGLRQYALIVWRWLWLVALSMALAGGAAFFTSRRQEPVYVATATLLINQAPNSIYGASYDSLITSERLASTYVELLRTPEVLEQVAARLKLSLSPELLAGQVSAEVVANTQLIRVTVEDTDPQRAAALVNALGEVFGEINAARQVSRYTSLKDNLNAQLAQSERDIQATQAEISAFPAERTPQQEARLGQLQAALAQSQNTYAGLLGNLAEVRLAEAQAVSDISVVQQAQAPASPIRPRTRMNTLLGAMVGALLALGVALLVEYLDDTLKTPEDIESLAHTSTLGLIARIEGQGLAQKLVAALSPRSPIAEAYRVLRTNIQFGSVDRPLRTLLVTSGNPTEGKSTTVANLAVVLAQGEKRVVAVDTDLRRPTLHEYFNLPNTRGVTTALLDGQAPIGEHLQATAMPNLRVMTSGPLPPNPAELLGSQRLRQVLEQLSQEADVVVLDSPPLLTVTDAALLARQVDATLLVVDAGITRRGILARALEALKSVNAPLLGVVLNRIIPSRASYYAYYYYAGGARRKKPGRSPKGHAPSATAPVGRGPAGQGLRRWVTVALHPEPAPPPSAGDEGDAPGKGDAPGEGEYLPEDGARHLFDGARPVPAEDPPAPTRGPALGAEPLVCPRCGEPLRRSHRRPLERAASWVVPLQRYRCPECGWSGVRAGRHG